MKLVTISRFAGKLLSALLITAATGFSGLAQSTYTVGTANDAGAESLRDAIIASEASPGLDFIDLTGITDTIKLVTALPTITQDLVITGPGKNLLAISGENLVRPFFITGGTVEITDLSITKGYAKGNDGAYRMGGGAGMGGAIYINAGTLNLASVSFTGNKSSGGNTGSTVTAGNGDGPIPGTAGSYGSNGSYYYAATNGTNGGFGAGGGGGGNDPFQLSTPGSGGYGGYGGGGGGSGTGSYNSYAPHYRATSTAFGGYGSVEKFSSSGGAGAGLGGALFIRSTATVYLTACEFNDNMALRGVTDHPDASNGKGKAGAIFIHPGAKVFTHSLTFSGNSADDAAGTTGDDSDVYGSVLAYVPGQPFVSIAAASEIKYNRAKLNGNVDANGNATSFFFEYSLSSDFSSVNNTDTKLAGSGSSPVAVSDSVTGLSESTTYYFRIIATNAIGSDTSLVQSFTTSGTPIPIVSTTTADPVEPTSATLNGLVNPNDFLTYYLFRYGTDASLNTYSETDSSSAGNGDVSVDADFTLTGLTSGTNYYFRIVARNSFGQSVGAIKSFKTKKLALPEATVSGAANVQPTTATVNGTVNSKGLETSYRFQYSPNGDFSAPMQSAVQTITSASVDGSGNAVSLNGSTGHLVIPDNGSMDVTTTFTIEAWINHNGKSYSTIIDKGSYQYLLSVLGSSIGFYSATGTGSSWKYSTETFPANQWIHVAVTFDANANEIKFYKNGVLTNTETGANAITPDNGNVNIGRQEPASCQCNTFGGKLDEVRFWNKALTDTDIQDNYQRTLTGSESGLMGYWSMDETNAVYTFDKTGNNNHAFLSGGASFTASDAGIIQEVTQVSATLTGLNPLLTYSYRLTATNSAGTAVSDTSTFKFKATVPDLELWLVADSNLVVDGDNKVVEWKSLTPNGAIAFQNNPTARPSQIVNSLNGHDVVRFDGSSDVLWTSPVSSDSGLTVIAVTKLSTNNGNWQRIVGNDRHYLVGYYGGNFRNYYGNGISWAAAGDYSSTTVGAFVIRSTTHDGSTDKSWQNGIPASPATSSRTGNTVPLTIGAGFEDGYFHQFLNGDIAELLVFNRTLSDAERVAIESRLAQKYKIGAKDVVSDPAIPQGETGNYVLGNTGATVTFTEGTDTPGTIDATVSSNPNINGNLPIGIQNLATEKYWSIVTSGLSGFTYSITLDLTGITGITDFNSIKVVKREDEFATWADVTGSPFFATVVYDEPFITISGLTSFSEFAVGSGAENPLPVELSAFSGQISGSNVVLNWTTTTETNNYGWEIEKQKVEDRSEKLEWETIGFVAGKGTTTEAQSYSYSSPATAGSLKFRLKQIDVDGKTTYSQIVSIEGKPTVLALNQNYPNPFNPSTTIGFALPASGKVNMVVFDILGREVATLLNKEMESGFHSVVFDASSYAAGVYFYKLTFNGKVVTKKLTLLK